ncbi:MAG: hypothetical protein IJH62_04120 [Mogibacterium sp.]|nr:hypothetical protein [Mogibacterium sp.]
MDMRYINETKQALSRLENLRSVKASRLLELHEYSDTFLKVSSRRSKKYYYAKNKGAEARVYLGDESNQEVRNIREFRYLKELIDSLDSEIALLRALNEGHLDISYEAVSERLPFIYRDPLLPGYTSGLPDAAKKWKAQKEREKKQYKQKNPEILIMRSIDGTLMRSKSEVIIANMLISYGIPFVYELPHVINGIMVYSDFTALSTIDFRSEVIIEHEGLMNDPNYQRIFLNKVNGYLAEGLIPGRDVFFTFDDLNGGFDPSPVQDMIDTRLRPRP